MTILEKLTADLTTSMKARDAFRTNTIRQAVAAIRTAEKSGPIAREITEEDVQKVLASEVKKRRESAQIYADAGAADRAATETAEADLFETYLPAVVTPEQLDVLVAEAIAATGAASRKDMGAVMKAVNAAAAGIGRVDGKDLSARVRGALGVA